MLQNVPDSARFEHSFSGYKEHPGFLDSAFRRPDKQERLIQGGQ